MTGQLEHKEVAEIVLSAWISEVTPDVNRRNGTVVEERQNVSTLMVFDEKTFVLKKGGKMTLILTDNRIFFVTGPIESWTFANIPHPHVKVRGPYYGTYDDYRKKRGGDQFPQGEILIRTIDRIDELERTLRQQEGENNTIGAMLTRVRMVELAKSVGMEAFANNHLVEADKLSHSLRGKIIER